MAAAELCDLKTARQILGKSQSEMAVLLGVSTRAVQSYEQGWRAMPCHVQQVTALMLYLNWRKAGHRAQPCWRQKDCSLEKRALCPAFHFKAGDLCWCIAGTLCGKQGPQTDWRAKMATCAQCPVTKEWLPR